MKYEIIKDIRTINKIIKGKKDNKRLNNLLLLSFYFINDYKSFIRLYNDLIRLSYLKSDYIEPIINKKDFKEIERFFKVIDINIFNLSTDDLLKWLNDTEKILFFYLNDLYTLKGYYKDFKSFLVIYKRLCITDYKNYLNRTNDKNNFLYVFNQLKNLSKTVIE